MHSLQLDLLFWHSVGSCSAQRQDHTFLLPILPTEKTNRCHLQMERKRNIRYKIIPNYRILFSSKASYNCQSSKGKNKTRRNTNKITCLLPSDYLLKFPSQPAITQICFFWLLFSPIRPPQLHGALTWLSGGRGLALRVTPRPRSHSAAPPGHDASHPPWAQAQPTDPASQRANRD